MSVAEPPRPEIGARPAPATRSDALAILDICPYLRTAGGWRSTGAQRDQRCHGVRPDARIALDLQRRLCLRSAHRECSTYLAAQASRLGAAADATGSRTTQVSAEPGGLWHFTRTAPTTLDDGRIGIPIPIAGRERTIPQTGLGAALVGVLAILVVARLAGGANLTPVEVAASPTVAVSAAVTPAASAPTATTPEPSPTPVPSPVATPASSLPPTPVASPTGAVAGVTATPTTRIYRVRAGDTLYAIALRFGVTLNALQAANDIEDPTRLRVGQILQIP